MILFIITFPRYCAVACAVLIRFIMLCSAVQCCGLCHAALHCVVLCCAALYAMLGSVVAEFVFADVGRG